MGAFAHLMLKEIYDQPVAISNVLRGRISPNGKKSRTSGF